MSKSLISKFSTLICALIVSCVFFSHFPGALQAAGANDFVVCSTSVDDESRDCEESSSFESEKLQDPAVLSATNHDFDLHHSLAWPEDNSSLTSQYLAVCTKPPKA
ncbi:MAG: hypothetical protein AB1540_07395 [Bdellovibrionota bacterium]